MPRVTHFEINADDPARAVKFYSDVFGWQTQQWGGDSYYLVQTGEGDGIDGAITKRDDPPGNIVNTVNVPSLDEAVAKVTAAGGSVISPKSPVPTIGWLAYCRDTEGNTFGLMQMDPNAG